MILKINDVQAGVRRPFRLEDINNIWEAFRSLAFGHMGVPKIISGFLPMQNGEGWAAGIIAFDEQLWYYPAKKGEIIPIGGKGFCNVLTSDDIRVFSNGTAHPFSFEYECSSKDKDGDEIGVFTKANVDKWRGSTVADGSITQANLDAAIQNKLNQIYSVRTVLNFNTNPMLASSVNPAFTEMPSYGSYIPIYAASGATGNPFSENVTGFAIMGGYTSLGSKNFTYIVMSSNPTRRDKMYMRTFTSAGVASDWTPVGSSMESVFKGAVWSNGTPADEILNIPLLRPVSTNDTIMILGYVDDNGENCKLINATFRPSDAPSSALELFNVAGDSWASDEWGIKFYSVSGTTLRLSVSNRRDALPSGWRFKVCEVFVVG